MNRILLSLIGLACSFIVPASGADVAPTISERGPHHRVWSRPVVTALSDNRSRTNFSSYVELASGLHRWDAQAGAWRDAEAVLEIENNTAVGRRTAHQVVFAANANTAGAITLDTPDGKRLRSHVLGVAWFDSANNNSLMIGSLKDSPGEVHPPNVVIYPDAFDGLKADLRYTHRLGGFEQDVILRENPPLPAGFAPDTTRLEVWTEFIEAPPFMLTQGARAGMTDDSLDFGAMQSAAGEAFALGDGPARRSGVPVAKRWLTIEGRTFLVESVRHNAVRPELNKLPAPNPQAAVPLRKAGPQLARAFQAERVFPAAPKPRPKVPGEVFRTAALKGSPRNLAAAGFVVDYDLQSALTNFTFQCDTTYYATNAVNLYGTTRFEGGTVVKFATNNTAQLNLNNTVVWETAQYRPAIFTAKDDNSVGAIIGSGTPSGRYAGVMLNLGSATNTPSNIRVSYARTAIKVSQTFAVQHAQFVHCDTAIDVTSSSTTLTVENALFRNVGLLRNGSSANSYLTARHVTVNGVAEFSSGVDTTSGEIINSILYDLSDWGNLEPELTSTYQTFSDEEPALFQTVGAAAHYLAAGSTHRNAGSTAGLSASLLADLRRRTTYPPIILSNQVITTDLTLSPQAQRDTDTLDRGYHYDPLDFVWSGLRLSNNVVVLNQGTAIGITSVSGGYGVEQYDGSSIVATGSPTNMVRVARYNCVQEQANTNWVGLGDTLRPSSATTSGANMARFSFVEWTLPANSGNHIYGAIQRAASIALQDCQVFGGNMYSFRPTFTASNCLFHRVTLGGDDGDFHQMGLTIRHSTLFGGRLDFLHGASDAWTFQNNLLDRIDTTWMFGEVTNSFNAYITNAVCSRLLPTNAATDVITNVAPAYQTGALGRFYMPSNSIFINAGSTNAHLLGLYHYTTTTNQWKETNSIVDIGFHYVAVNSSGLPVDTDSDGVPDYLEDANGNGSLDHRETKPNDAADGGLRVFITRPRSGSTIP